METFEQQFENLDLRINVTNDAMHSATTIPSAQSDVDLLMQQVADENGIELNYSMPATQSTGISSSLAIGISNASHDQDELSKRLAKLRQPWEDILELKKKSSLFYYTYVNLNSNNIFLNTWLNILRKN